MTDLERHRAATVRPWIRRACQVTIALGCTSVLFLAVGLLFHETVTVEWAFGGDHGWTYAGSVVHPLGLLVILEMMLWALAGWAILRGKRWALDVAFFMLAFQTLDWFLACVLQVLDTLPYPSFQIAFVFPLLVIAIASGQWEAWRSPSDLEI